MLKRNVAVFTFTILPCLSSLAGAPVHTAHQEDTAVLQVALISLCQAKNGYVVLSSTTAAPRPADDMGDADESGAFSDLERRNGSAALLPEVLECQRARLIREQEIQRFFDQQSNLANKVSLDDAWKKFYKSFPGATGWTSVSLPGYSPDGEIAIVYMAHYCGSLCGGGSYVYLRRVKGKWKVLVDFPDWVS
ncbi:hypothetical protein [Dyella nitratireducens]|uniref:DUF4440 domain-containing protein n=1 Tax=Dyella nitratireducens TaxID=1849580 RepID=A0ABQ1FSN9_9GAMM|nr:hypothetical protein [Dyella nitratireducens]GGA29484.1 hypothetical protein GCM10010981_18020 [Dyella nitratireducens]GLQ43133.1 hypothetical protein GCM10007902_29830 [Dyella nitratireducens]